MNKQAQLSQGAEPLLRSTRDAPVPMAVFSLRHQLLAASKSWEQITNLQSKDYCGLTVQEVWPDFPTLIALHQRAAAGEHFVNPEEEYIDSEGVRRWLCNEYRPMWNPRSELTGYFVHGHDVTPMMQAREAAQAAAERLRLALGAARAGVCELNLTDKTMWVSPEFTEIVGVDAEFDRFARDPWWMAHPDDKPAIQKVISAWKGPRHEPLDFRIQLPSGETRWVEIHGEQQRDSQGRRTKIVGLILDIDARKRQELALADARRDAQINAERLGMALKAARAGVVEVSFTAQTFWCSPEFEEIVGRSMTFDEAVGECWPIIHPDDQDFFIKTIAQWSETFTFGSLEARALLPSGESRWINISGDIKLTEDGLPDKLSCMVLDIDARKRQELALSDARQDLRTNAERLKLAMDAAQAGAFETNFKEQSFWCSPEFIEVVGRALTFQESMGVWPMTHPDDVAVVQAAIDRSAAGEAGSALEWRIVLPSGEVRWIDGRAVPHLGEDGVPDKLAGLVMDIDERKRQELALVEAERAAQAAAEAKAQFLANMSHEIRTPMNGVLGVLHLLQSEHLSDEGRSLLAEASNCGRMLSQLLDDVIDFSRIEAGRLELSPEPIDPAQVLASVIGLLRPNATAKGLELRSQVPVDDVWILADPVRVRQALFNLIGNAVKFTPAGHVEARLTVTDIDGRRRLRFEVEDTGVGISKSNQASLFRRFQQADGSTSRRFGGSGLGLAITRRLAELMDGEVGFTSCEDEGSTFWFEIAADCADPPSATNSESAPALEGLKVLLVEDNPTNRLVASKILQAMGVEVDMAENGSLGVDAVMAGDFDLILMDVQMPVMDGLEATRRIRALEGAKGTIPILGLTANAMAHQKRSYLSIGMNGVVAKPISPTDLFSEIARVVSEGANHASAAA